MKRDSIKAALVNAAVWKAVFMNALFFVAAASMLISGALLLFTWGRDMLDMAYWRDIERQKEALGDWTGQGILPQFQSLYERNPDFVGWLSIEGTNYLNYPVMQSKDDPEHYLWRNFDGEAGWGGTPFADYRCDVVPVKGFNTVIYGHNGAFRRLYDYEYQRWRMYQRHRLICFDTLNEEALYEVAAVFYLDARDAVLLDPWDPDDPLAYACYNYLEVDSPDGFRRYLDRVAEQRLYEADADITLRSHVLTLICCATEPYSGIEETNGVINGRFVVIAVQVEP